MAEHLPHLEQLSLSNCSLLTDAVRTLKGGGG
jgi:hypothetical protein